jgi:membrane protein required for colicin V production
MHWLDSTLLALLALGAGVGFMTGLLLQVARVAGLGVALWATLYCNEQAVQLIQEFLLRDADAHLVKAAAYTAVFVVVYILLLIVTRFVKSLIVASGFAWMDRFLGACLATVKTAAILGAVCLLLSRATNATTQEWMTRCTVAPALSRGMEMALVMIPDDYKKSLADSLVSLRAKVEEQEISR